MARQTKAQKKKAVSRMNKESEKPLRVRFCPQCKATDVGFVFKLQNVFGLLPRVECYKCGHYGPEFPLLIVTKDELQKRSQKKSSKKKSTQQKVSFTKRRNKQ